MAETVHPIPQRIGPYRVEEALARGGMGAVYRCRALHSQRAVAVKTVFDSDPISAQAIRREARLLDRVRHPGVVQLLESGEDTGRPWYAMELAGPSSLRDRLNGWFGRDRPERVEELRAADTAPAFDRRGQLTSREEGPQRHVLADHLKEALRLCARICQTLGWLHGEGVVHLDLKPANILIDQDDRPVLVDFGVTRNFAGARAREVLEASGHVAGTEHYMAPEQIRGGNLDARTDLYAVGCMLFEMLSARPPFTAATGSAIWHQHLTQIPPALSSVVEGLPVALDALVANLLQKKPEARVGRADDVVAALEALGAEADPVLAQRRPRPYLYRPVLAGRDGVLDEAKRMLEATKAGEGSSLLISGESGSGKTRLAIEISNRASQAGFTVITGECSPSSSGSRAADGTPLEPLRPVFELVADRCHSEGESARKVLLGERAGLLAAVYPPLSDFIGGQAPPPTLSAEVMRSDLIRACIDTLYALADEGRPVLLIVDDMQWVDDLTAATLKRLQRALATRSTRLWLVLLARTSAGVEELTALGSGAMRSWLKIEPLTNDDVTKVVAGMLAHTDPPPMLVDLAHTRAGGNPFEIAEVLHAAVDAGLIEYGHGRWTLADDAEAIARSLPQSVDAMVGLRFDRLDDDACSVLKAAATFGRMAATEDLEALLEWSRPQVEAATEDLVAARILEEDGQKRVRFVHDRVRERAYQQMPEDARLETHRRAAQLLTRRGEHPSDLAALARHLRASGQSERLCEIALRTGARAMEIGAHQTAENFYREALALIDNGVQVADADEADAICNLGRALQSRGETDVAMPFMLLAMKKADIPMPTTRLRLFLRLGLEMMRQFAHVGGRTGSSRVTVAQRQLFAVIESIPTFIVSNRRLEFLVAALTGANIADRLGLARGAVRAYSFVGMVAGFAGFQRAADRYFARALDLARASQNPEAMSHHAQVACFYLANHARFDEVEALGSEALEITLQAGALHLAEPLIYVLSLKAWLNGELSLARERADWLLELSVSSGSLQYALSGRIKIAHCEIDSGSLEAALETMNKACTFMDDDLAAPWRANGFATRALILARLGKSADARQDLERTRAELKDVSRGNPIIYNVNAYLPEVELRLGHLEKSNEVARAHFGQARTELKFMRAHAKSTPILRSRLLLTEAMLCALEGDNAKASRLAIKSGAVATTLGLDADRAQAALDAAHWAKDPPAEQALLPANTASLLSEGQDDAAAKGEVVGAESSVVDH